MYNRAHEKVFRQLDVVNILRWIEQFKLLTKVLLDHKQKFWLKFQKEHILEIDENSEEERNRKRAEREKDEADFVVKLHGGDQAAIEKVDRMFANLKHANRTSFDQKILQGLFEEYKSDSEEEERENRVMNTQEMHEEFYSLSMPPPPQKRGREFNKRIDKDDVFDLSSLRNLYKKEDGLIYIGPRSQTTASPTLATKSFKKMKTANVKSSPIAEVLGASPLGKSNSRKLEGILHQQSMNSKTSKKHSQKIHQIHEDSDEESSVEMKDSDSGNNKRQNKLEPSSSDLERERNLNYSNQQIIL